jgi:hypothetical protein
MQNFACVDSVLPLAIKEGRAFLALGRRQACQDDRLHEPCQLGSGLGNNAFSRRLQAVPFQGSGPQAGC